MFYPYVICLVIIFLYMSAFFVLATIKKNAGLVDIGWGLGFVLLTWFTYFYNGSQVGVDFPQTLMTLLVTGWGLRLAVHIYRRNKNKAEDFRYQAWRQKWPHYYLRSYFQIFLLQGIFMFIISLPILVTNFSQSAFWPPLFYLGVIVWLIGYFFEVLGDWQLATFVKDKSNKGKILTTGLWRYTRHPNYFGEVSLWWGIFFMALSTTEQLLLIVSPLLITFLILKISGIPMLEKKYLDNPEFQSYKKRTNAFFPWFPK